MGKWKEEEKRGLKTKAEEKGKKMLENKEKGSKGWKSVRSG